MSLGSILVIIGVILIIISAFWNPAPRPTRTVSFWNLGWGFVLAGLLIFGGTAVGTT